jgi:predicted ATP-binding protein involved in virulence
MLKELNIANFTAFPKANFEFSPGLNVIVGENGTGKSHILKLAYSIIAANAEEKRKSRVDEINKSVMQRKYADKLMNVFRPDSLGRLASRSQGRIRCELQVKFDDSALDCSFSLATNSKSEVQIEQLPQILPDQAPVFLPTRELLSIYPGFVAMYENRYLQFDETYRDTCLLLSQPAVKGPKEKSAAKLLKPLESAMGGKVVLDTNDRFYLSIPGNGNMEIPLVAEGVRKLAMLARLISTGALLGKGYLFWDEPEANLNPRLIKSIASSILSLADAGIQVFIATHSIFLLRELAILKENNRTGSLSKYFSLKQTEEGVQVEQGNSLEDIQTLVMLDEELQQSDRYMAME